jgi:hypothetical protein
MLLAPATTPQRPQNTPGDVLERGRGRPPDERGSGPLFPSVRTDPAGASTIYCASMQRRPTKQTPVDPFETVRTVGLALPDVEATKKHDGSPVLKVGGAFMAGLATHRSAATLVVRANLEERAWLIEDAPEAYYLTDHYRSHPVVLARLLRIDRNALRDLLSMSWRLTLAKARNRGRMRRHGEEIVDV